jgi:hypothetical protein
MNLRIVQKAGLLIALAGVAVLPVSADVFDLGAASGFSVFSGGILQDQGVTFATNGLVGGVGGTSGFPSADVATSTQIAAANTAFDTAYTDEFNAAGSATPSSSLPSILTPGDYQTTGGITLPTTLTFNGAGDYIIRINGSLMDNATSFVLENGATANDILFLATGADVENGGTFDGTIFVNGSATVRAAAGGGEITGGIFSMGSLDIQYINPGLASTETIDAPSASSAVPEPTSVLLLVTILGICGYGLKRRSAA